MKEYEIILEATNQLTTPSKIVFFTKVINYNKLNYE